MTSKILSGQDSVQNKSRGRSKFFDHSFIQQVFLEPSQHTKLCTKPREYGPALLDPILCLM